MNISLDLSRQFFRFSPPLSSVPLGNQDRTHRVANIRPRAPQRKKAASKYYEPFGSSYGVGHASNEGHHEGPNWKDERRDN